MAAAKALDFSIFNGKLINKDGKLPGDLDPANYDYIGLYFSAHWCPPCRGFTPELAAYYNERNVNEKFHIVFVSADRDEKAFKKYLAEMPWLALDFSERDLETALSTQFGIRGIPTLVILRPDGSIVSMDGRGAVAGKKPFSSLGKNVNKNSRTKKTEK